MAQSVAPSRRRSRRISAALALVFAIYLTLAYCAVPEIWLWRDRRHPLAPGTMLTTTVNGIPGDPINIGIVGAKADIVAAFHAAGWTPADAITLRTAIGIGLSVLLDRPDPNAPVSTLLFDGRVQDLAFEKQAGVSADQRHHVRFWLAGPSAETGPKTGPKTGEKTFGAFWLGAASFDRGVGLSHETGQITHHIDPNLDAERDLVLRDLEAAGRVASSYAVEGVGATNDGRNGGGDSYVTDGKAIVLVLSPPRDASGGG